MRQIIGVSLRATETNLRVQLPDESCVLFLNILTRKAVNKYAMIHVVWIEMASGATCGRQQLADVSLETLLMLQSLIADRTDPLKTRRTRLKDKVWSISRDMYDILRRETMLKFALQGLHFRLQDRLRRIDLANFAKYK